MERWISSGKKFARQIVRTGRRRDAKIGIQCLGVETMEKGERHVSLFDRFCPFHPHQEREREREEKRERRKGIYVCTTDVRDAITWSGFYGRWVTAVIMYNGIKWRSWLSTYLDRVRYNIVGNWTTSTTFINIDAYTSLQNLLYRIHPANYSVDTDATSQR